MTVKKLTDSQVDEVLHYLREGLTTKEIERRMKLPYRVGKMIPPERMEEYRKAIRLAQSNRWRKRKKTEGTEPKRDLPSKETRSEASKKAAKTEVEEAASPPALPPPVKEKRDVVKEVAVREPPKSETVPKPQPKRKKEGDHVSWWKKPGLMVAIAVGGAVMLGIMLWKWRKSQKTSISMVQPTTVASPPRVEDKVARLRDKYKVI